MVMSVHRSLRRTSGTALLGVAVTLLWRSRKPGRLRYVRRAAIVVATVVLAY
jgi:hypothetical protein